ncbi:excalibur calcium-binding domain-containing protein [Streptomyces sp. NPDC005374]|uniref:excalibur calcium-binding domain-containing protein n=1 Tax=Streptomyces sp. NPDC005374 TaxID=3364713 RepID=UPI00368F93AF
MKLLRKPGAIAVAALALAVLPGAASAHDGDQPFENCTEAYAAGYANIPEGDEHYGSQLDRDGDGIGCDRPPADFEPHDDDAAAAAADDATGKKDRDLAETGGGDTTVYLAAAGSAVLLTGGALVASARRRRAMR